MGEPSITKIRVSIGSAGLLGLKRIIAEVDPTTCYIMTHSPEGCQGRCGFCPQGHIHNERDLEQLSRVQWPEFQWLEFIKAFMANQNQTSRTNFKRICVQVLKTSSFFTNTLTIIKDLHNAFPKIKISAAIPPISKKELKELHEAGLERVGIALDACTAQLFDKIKGQKAKGPYTWDNHWEALYNALEIFGKGYVTTHFIVGLGETEEEMVYAIENAIKNYILPGIFLFTAIKGTPLEKQPRPEILHFRHIQLARALLLRELKNMNKFLFQNGRLIKIKEFAKIDLENIIENGFAFKTAGCPDCNRPYYTSRPGEEPDGFPRDLKLEEKAKIWEDLSHLIDEA